MRLSRQRKVKVLDQGPPRDLRGCGQIDTVPLSRVLDAAWEEAGAAAAHFPVAERAVPCSVRARRVPRMVGAATRRAPCPFPPYDSGVFARDPHVLRLGKEFRTLVLKLDLRASRARMGGCD